jgi:hypothetical protein
MEKVEKADEIETSRYKTCKPIIIKASLFSSEHYEEILF